jgi:hypothetical protein
MTDNDVLKITAGSPIHLYTLTDEPGQIKSPSDESGKIKSPSDESGQIKSLGDEPGKIKSPDNDITIMNWKRLVGVFYRLPSVSNLP